MGLTGGERTSLWHASDVQVRPDRGTGEGPHRDPLLDPGMLLRVLDVLHDL